jgi:uncharacterized protein
MCHTLFSMDQSLLTTLRMHNPWLDDPANQQSLLQRLLPHPYLSRRRTLELRPGRADLVVGPRQAGKSTWIIEALSRQQDPVLILNAEEPRIREICRSPALALDALRSVLTPSSILFLEEIQHLDDAPLFIKGLVDLDARRRFVVTGSSSFQFRGRTRESLAGRARRTRLMPFSLQEVQDALSEERLPAIQQAMWLESWEKLLVTGGYPEAWLDPEPQLVLHHLVESFVLKDASDLHRIEHPAAFRRLLELAAADVGNLVNLSAWASLTEVSRTTVQRYLEIAEEAHVLQLVPPFVGGRRAEVTGTPKVFYVDNGLRNTLFAGFSPLSRRPDLGALWENTVFAELAKRLDLLDELRFWRSKNGAEVDFVVRRRDRLLAIEVKAADLKRPAITRAARSFIAAYRPACLGVINGSLRADVVEENTVVRFRRPWEMGDLLDALDD